MVTAQGKLIPVGVSARHVHLSAADLATLFGPQAELHVLRELSQRGQFAAKELVMIVGPKGAIANVRVLGPIRRQTQVEVSRTDSFQLGVSPVVRSSGDVNGTPGIVIMGPNGAVVLPHGVIVAMRHIHMPPSDAEELELTDGETIKVAVQGERALVFHQVLVRVDPTFALEMHLDTDEANGCGVQTGDLVAIVPPEFDIPNLFDEEPQPRPQPSTH